MFKSCFKRSWYSGCIKDHVFYVVPIFERCGLTPYYFCPVPLTVRGTQTLPRTVEGHNRPRGTGRGRPSPSRPDLDDSRRLFFVCLVFAWFSKRSLYIFFMHSYTAQRGRRRVTRPEKPRPTKVAAETSPGLAGPREAWRAFPPHHLTSPPESQTNSPPVRCTFVKRARGGGGAI